MKWIFTFLWPYLLFAEVDFSLDEDGRLKTVQSSDGTLSYSYDYNETQQIVTSHDLINGTNAKLAYGEGAVSLPPEDFPMLRQKGVQYTYDALDRVSEAVLPDQFRFVFTYDGFNQCIAHNYYEWEDEDWKLKGRKGYSNLWEMAGTALQQYCYHTIPFPGVRHMGIYMGEWLGAVPIPEEDKECCVGIVGEKRLGNIRTHVVINGLNTNLRDAIAFAQFISEAFDNEKVIYAYNATHGFIPDLWEYISQTLYIETPAFQVGLEAIRRALDESGPEDVVTVWAHSLGGLILQRVLEKLPTEEKKKLQIFTFGTSAFFHKGDLKEVRHIVSRRDLIPHFGDPLRYFSAPWFDESLIHVIPAADGWALANHALFGPAYQKEILRMAQTLKNANSGLPPYENW